LNTFKKYIGEIICSLSIKIDRDLTCYEHF
jgi:hypothetical protein